MLRARTTSDPIPTPDLGPVSSLFSSLPLLHCSTYDGQKNILQVNISCNFFRGQFDQALYFEFMESYFKGLDTVRWG